jgi:excisionase family DNA binding protein
MTSPWLTVSEGAEYVRASDERTVRAAIKNGDIPAYTYGKSQIRLKASDLDAWLEARPFEPRTA